MPRREGLTLLCAPITTCEPKDLACGTHYACAVPVLSQESCAQLKGEIPSCYDVHGRGELDRFQLTLKVEEVIMQPIAGGNSVLQWLTGHRDEMTVAMQHCGNDGSRQQTAPFMQAPPELQSGGEPEVKGTRWVPAHSSQPADLQVHMCFNVETKSELELLVLSETSSGGIMAPKSEDAAKCTSVLAQLRWRVVEHLRHALTKEKGRLSLHVCKEDQVQGMITFTVSICEISGVPSHLVQWVRNHRILELYGHSDQITCCATFPCNRRMVTGSKNSQAIIWNCDGVRIADLQGMDGSLKNCAVFHSGDKVLTLSAHDVCVIWSITGKQIMKFSGVKCFAMFPSGDRVLLISSGGTGIIWSSSGEQLSMLEGHINACSACAVSSCGEYLVTASADGAGVIWSVRGLRIAELNGHSDAIVACAAIPSAQKYITISKDKTGIVWSSTGSKLAVLEEHEEDLIACAVFPFGERLVTVSGEPVARLWHASGKKLAELRHSAQVTACAVFPKGDRMVTSSQDKTAIVWSRRGDQLAVLKQHAAGVTSCTVFPSGDWVLTASEDKVAIVWPMALCIQSHDEDARYLEPDDNFLY